MEEAAIITRMTGSYKRVDDDEQVVCASGICQGRRRCRTQTFDFPSIEGKKKKKGKSE